MRFSTIKENTIQPEDSWDLVLVLVCIYLFLFIERPWESISLLKNLPIERLYAILMIVIALIAGRLKIVDSPTNKWVYGLLALHFILAPFAFNSTYSIDQGIEYAKMVVLYVMMLAVAEDERSLKVLIKAFIFSMMLYMLHSLLAYYQGRHVWRMGISRMIGVDATYNDPNSFGASAVLSLPFVYTLLRCEIQSAYRKLYYAYFALALVCIVLTGSRSAFVALIFLLILWGIVQKGKQRFILLIIILFSVCAIWIGMPSEKRNRIRTLWDQKAGPANATESANGRIEGFKVSWEMFKLNPFTGVGAGGENFIGYRVTNKIDHVLGNEISPTQSHNLYGQVLAEFGVLGTFLFIGLIFTIATCCISKRKSILARENKHCFCFLLTNAILSSLLLLLILGLAGHNFNRPLWLWLAAWAGTLKRIEYNNGYST